MYRGKKVIIIAAVSENGVIGFKGSIPWDSIVHRYRLNDLTLGSTVIYGRKTFDSFGEPLRDRTNIVLTHKPEKIKAKLGDQKIYLSTSLEAAICMADTEEVFVLGGQKPFQDALRYADEMYLTRVHLPKVAGDRIFKFNDVEWQMILSEEREEKDFKISLQTYCRTFSQVS